MRWNLFVSLVVLFCIGSFCCRKSPYRNTNKLYKKQANSFAARLKKRPEVTANDTLTESPYFVGTTNFTMRKPNFVIIHHTAQDSVGQTLKTFTLPKTEVSAHYLIAKNGTVFHMLNDYLRAHHAGVGKWGNTTDMNSCSIGIEIDNNGTEAFTDVQISSLLVLLRQLKQTYNIPTANFIGHADFAPGRKKDPSILFPWEKLAKNGFGLWYGDTLRKAPENFNCVMALRIIGYDIKDSTAAIKAFKMHFLQDTSRKLSPADRDVIFDLMSKS